MPRRIVNIRVDHRLFAAMMFASQPGQWHRTDSGLPKDAKCIGCGHDWERQMFWFTFENESFPEVPDGEYAPMFSDVRLSTFCFESPTSDKTIAELNALTEKQIEVAKSAHMREFNLSNGVVMPLLNLVPDHVREEKP